MLKPEVFSEKSLRNAIKYHPNDDSRTVHFTYNQLWEAITSVRKVLEKCILQGYYFGVALAHSPALIAVISGIHLSNSAFCCLKVQSINSAPMVNILQRISTSYCFFYKAGTKHLSANQTKFKVVADLDLLQEQIVLLQFDFSSPCTKASHNIVYCVATSGSTGEPKFVRVPTECIVPNLVALEKLFKLDESDRILVSCPPTFDPFVVDVFLALRNGSCLILAANEIRLHVGRLRRILFEQDAVTFMQITPSLLRQWSDDLITNVMLAKHSSLRHLVLGGEPFPIGLKIPEKSLTNVYNIYGITEVSCWATIEKVRTASSGVGISIGEPIDDTIELQLCDVGTGKVLNSEQTTRPIRGNLHIGSRVRKCLVGDELAEDVFQCNTICYRSTGDLVELQSDGKFYYLGRCDDMVKRLGVRVNLGWLERCADQCEGISKSCAIFEPTQHRIVLFYTLCDRSTQMNNVRKLLEEKLSEEELPDECILVDELPLSDHGKTDRKKCLQQLQDLDSSKQGTHRRLKQIFNEKIFDLLGISLFPTGSDESKRTKFDLGCSFIDAGGTSIQALQLVTSLQDCSGTTVPDLIGMLLDKAKSLKDIFQYLDGYHPGAPVVSFESQKDVQQLSTKITIQTHFSMEKCIDASPTEYYSEKHQRRIVAVGSHSHKVLLVDVGKDLTITELVLPDRVESAVSYLADRDQGLVGCYDGKLYCFDIWSGAIRWTFDSGGMIKCKPLVDDSVIIFGSYSEENNLFALDLSGSLVWKMHLGSKGILSSPVSLGNGNAFVATLDGTYCCFTVKSGAEVWRGKLESPVFANTVRLQQQDSILLTEVQGRMHCLASNSGNKIWQISTGGNLFSSPQVVATSSDSIDILLGCHDKHLYCFNLSTGKYPSEDPILKWKLRLQSPIYAAPSVANRLAVICSTSGWVNLICLENARPLGVLKLDGEIFSTPLIVDLSAVYVGCRDNTLYKLSVCS